MCLLMFQLKHTSDPAFGSDFFFFAETNQSAETGNNWGKNYLSLKHRHFPPIMRHFQLTKQGKIKGF